MPFSSSPMRRPARCPPLPLSVADVADGDVRRLEVRVEEHGRDAGAGRFLDRALQRLAVERRQHDALDALAGEAFDDLDLLLAIVLADRALPQHRTGVPGGGQLGGGLLGPDASRAPSARAWSPWGSRQSTAPSRTRRCRPAPRCRPPSRHHRLDHRPPVRRSPGPRRRARTSRRVASCLPPSAAPGAARHYHGPTMPASCQP